MPVAVKSQAGLSLSLFFLSFFPPLSYIVKIMTWVLLTNTSNISWNS